MDRRVKTAVAQFAHALVVAAQNRTLHGRDSGHVQQALAALLLALRAAATAGCELPLRLQFSDDWIYHDGEPLVGPSLQARELLAELAAREVATLAFGQEADADELNRLFDLLLLPQNRDALQRRHREHALAAYAVRNVRLTSRTPVNPSDRNQSIANAIDDLHRYQELAASLQHNHARAHRDLGLAVDRASSAIERAIVRMENEPSGLLSLAAQDNVDRFTVGHSVRVALLALQVARAAGASRDQLVQVGTAALLHDIGKSKVPQEILFKQGPLDDDEWRWMAQHPRLGANLLLEQRDLDPSAIGAAFCHHLRADGSGYPSAAVPIQPSGTSRLVRVCDVFEALTSVRPYKRALTPCEAFAVMRRDPRDFDQQWLRLFVRTLGIFPVGSRVQLRGGALAVVVRQSERPDQPVVRLLSGPDDAPLPPGAPDEVRIGAGAPRIETVVTHDRTVPLPEPDAAAPAFLTQTVHGACVHDGRSASPRPRGGSPGRS
jgi:putative nucleotidyltransferase with HDIG domain